MYRIMNQGGRDFIVSASEVIKGGKPYSVKGEKVIHAGEEIVEVSNSLGKSLASYKGVKVIEIVKEGKTK